MKKMFDAVLSIGMGLAFVAAFVGLFSYQMWMVLLSAIVMVALLYADDSRRLARFRRKMNEDKA